MISVIWHILVWISMLKSSETLDATKWVNVGNKKTSGKTDVKKVLNVGNPWVKRSENLDAQI